MRYSDDMFRYTFKSELVTLVSLKSPVGPDLCALPLNLCAGALSLLSWMALSQSLMQALGFFSLRKQVPLLAKQTDEDGFSLMASVNCKVLKKILPSLLKKKRKRREKLPDGTFKLTSVTNSALST